jgi:4-amino-4-deoxy-L-arabinose transferase-like glycosyltransferase
MKNFFKKRKRLIPLFLILLIASFLRFYQLDKIPPGIHADEADTAYSAYSILSTGLTQYGDFNLLAFTEFNVGTHPPVYTYILMPLTYLFGMNIFVERLPSAIAGVGSVLIFYLFLKNIFKSEKVALTGALLIAINPWAIHMSRQGLLESLSLFFVVSGVTLFLYAKTNKKFILSAILLGLSLHTYDAPKVILPFLILGFIIYRWTFFIKNKKNLTSFILVFLLFFLLMLSVLFNGQIRDYESVSILGRPEISRIVDSERYLTNAPLWLSGIFHNKITVIFSTLITNYVKVFSVNWMFLNGDGNLQQAIGNYGQYFLFELPFFFLGIFNIFKTKIRIGCLLLFWMLIAPIPGAITSTGNFPYRAILLLPVPIMFSSYGLVSFWESLKKKSILNFSLKATLVVLSMMFVLGYLYTYFFDYPVYASERWAKQQNGAIKYAITEEKKYSNIYLDGGRDWLMMYGFFTKKDPKLFQRSYKDRIDYKGAKFVKIDNFYFGDISEIENCKELSLCFPKNSLVITSANNFKSEKPQKSFYDPGNVRIIFNAFVIR